MKTERSCEAATRASSCAVRSGASSVCFVMMYLSQKIERCGNRINVLAPVPTSAEDIRAMLKTMGSGTKHHGGTHEAI
jgi:hypothetical protein